MNETPIKKSCLECHGYAECTPRRIKECINHNYSLFKQNGRGTKNDRRVADRRK
jgi:hypothetical protein